MDWDPDEIQWIQWHQWTYQQNSRSSGQTQQVWWLMEALSKHQDWSDNWSKRTGTHWPILQVDFEREWKEWSGLMEVNGELVSIE